MSFISIKIDAKDAEALMNDCTRIYLKHHPEMEAIRLTRRKMFHEVVRFYIEAP